MGRVGALREAEAMATKKQVRLSGELAERVEAVADSIRPRPAFSATAEMLVEDGLRLRDVTRAVEAMREEDRSMCSGDYFEGNDTALKTVLRLLMGGA